MKPVEASTRDKVIEALARSDASTRDERAARLEWLSPYGPSLSAIIGPVDTLRLMEEARVSFVNGQFVAALVLATSFIEHTLADELGLGQGNDRTDLQSMIKLARTLLGLPHELLNGADRLRELRNPFTHRRPITDHDTLGYRYSSAKAHPRIIMETDAKLAMRVMYELFQCTLRSA